MKWRQRHRVRHYFRNSIWVLPSLSIFAALIAVRLASLTDEAMGLTSWIEPDAMRTLLGTLAASMFTFVVFVGSALLIAVQLASAQLTPRIIAFVFRDPVTKLSLSLFVFIFTFSLSVLIRIKTTVPLISTYVSAYGFMLSLVVFLYLVDHVGKVLRASGALRAVGRLGRAVVESVYSRRFAQSPEVPADSATTNGGETCRTISSPRDGAVLAFDIQGLRDLAQRADCVI